MKVYLNTIYRIIPGVWNFLVLVIIIYICFAQSYFLVFSPYLKDFRTFQQTILTIIFKQFYTTDEFEKFVQNRDFSYLKTAGLLSFLTNQFILMFFIALVTVLYKKAVGFEKGAEIITPDKQRFSEDIQQIKEQVNQIYQKHYKVSIMSK